MGDLPAVTSEANGFVTVGDLRRLISSLPDEASVLLQVVEDDEEGPLICKMRYASLKRALTWDMRHMDWDLNCFDNDAEGSEPVLLLSHDTAPQSLALEHSGPGQTISRPMRQIRRPA